MWVRWERGQGSRDIYIIVLCMDSYGAHTFHIRSRMLAVDSLGVHRLHSFPTDTGTGYKARIRCARVLNFEHIHCCFLECLWLLWIMPTFHLITGPAFNAGRAYLEICSLLDGPT